MRPISILAFCLALVVQEFHALAQVPHVMTYQGRVASGGTNFSGTGQFKFALVSGGTSAAAQANASATVFFGFVVQIAVTRGGAGYTAAPAVTITDSSGSGASAIAQIANGQVTGITVTDAGSGYSASPSITIAPPAANVSYTTYWSNDDTSSAGGEPASVVPVSVSQGLFTVGLGDTMIPNMSALPPQVLANPDVRLRMWFNDGVNGFSQLSPDQRLTSAAYAMMADTVRDGAITSAKLAPNSITSAQIAPGSITVSQLADGAVTSAKLAANVNVGSIPGTIVVSTNANDVGLINDGFVRLDSARLLTDEWTLLESDPAVHNLESEAMVWTGTEVIRFGRGYTTASGSGFYGERFDPTTKRRQRTSSDGAPRFDEIWREQIDNVVWTGTEAILWGYTNAPFGFRPTFAYCYNPAFDTWRRLTVPSYLTNSYQPTVLWTGTEIIVWMGAYYGGGRYRPESGLWTAISGTGAPDSSGPAVWTGSEMLVFGVNDLGTSAGRRYNPVSNVWRNIPGAADILTLAEGNSKALWIGSEAIYFGSNLNSPWGGRYNPTLDTWTSFNLRAFYFFDQEEWSNPVWTGTSVVMVGGGGSPKSAQYDPSNNSWSLSAAANPIHCTECSTTKGLWTGSELLYISKRYDGGYSQFYSYQPKPPFFLYQKR